MPKRQSNNPKRRIMPLNRVSQAFLHHLVKQAQYAGSAHHKRRAADYGFNPPANPRPSKSLCDGNRTVKKNEAEALFHEGIRRGMVSIHHEDDLPKHVWAVDDGGRAYEANIEKGSRKNYHGNYHGYELGDDDGDMKKLVIKEWKRRCPII